MCSVDYFSMLLYGGLIQCDIHIFIVYKQLRIDRRFSWLCPIHIPSLYISYDVEHWILMGSPWDFQWEIQWAPSFPLQERYKMHVLHEASTIDINMCIYIYTRQYVYIYIHILIYIYILCNIT